MIKKWNYFALTLSLLIIIGICYIIKNQIKEYHLQDDPMLHTLKEVLRPIMWNGKSIVENLKLYKGDKSYTINKSQTFLCLKDRNGEYYPLNMLIHVLLHEIAHSLNTTDVGHTDAFYKIFNELSEKASELGIFNPSIPIIQDYCP